MPTHGLSVFLNRLDVCLECAQFEVLRYHKTIWQRDKKEEKECGWSTEGGTDWRDTSRAPTNAYILWLFESGINRLLIRVVMVLGVPSLKSQSKG